MSSTTTDRLAGVTASLSSKAPVRAATTANITLSGAQTIDGVAVVADDRVLVKNQTDGIENGIYDAKSGAWVRSLDFDGTRDVVSGTFVVVAEGTAGAGTAWRISTTGTITIGTTSIAFALMSIETATAFILTLLDDATAAAALTTLTAAGTGEDNTLTGDNTFSGANTFSGINTFSAQVLWAKGGDIASASPLVIDTDGNYFDVTGTTGFSAMTVTAGMLFMLQFDGALTMTHHATNLNLPGAANITTAAGDRLIGFATGANTVHVLTYDRADGSAIVVATQAQMETGTNLTVPVTPGRQHNHPGHSKALLRYDQTGPLINLNYNIASVTDTAAGNFSVNLLNAFSGTTYMAVGHSDIALGVDDAVMFQNIESVAAGVLVVHTRNTGGALADCAYNALAFFGDQ